MSFPTRFDQFIRMSAFRWHVDPRLVKALVRKESNFDPNAIRGEPQLGDASIGLMQILLSTARRYAPGITVDELKDPATNLDLGTRYLAELLAKGGGDWWRAVSAYNGGWRPELGFGTVLTRPLTLCLAWKATAPTTGRSIDRDCAKKYDAKIGEFGNQPYVTDVAQFVNQVSQEWAGLAPAGGTAMKVVGILLAAGGVGLLGRWLS